MKLYQIDTKLSFAEPDVKLPDADVPCAGCSAPCCTTPNWTVFLTYEEAHRLPYTFADVTFPSGQEVEFVAVLPRHPVTGACVFVRDGMCTVWERRPAVCRQYDCRKDPNPTIRPTVEGRFNSDGSLRLGAPLIYIDPLTKMVR